MSDSDADVLEMLETLSRSSGLPGHESGVSGVVADALRALCDEVRLDRLGNCIGLRRGEGEEPRPRVMFAAHMDEVGLIVTKIEEGGFLRFSSMGGVDPRILPGSEVRVLGSGASLAGIVGVKPPHIIHEDDTSEAIKADDMYIDTGLTEEEVRRRVRVGDVVSLNSTFARLGGLVSGKSLDDRAGVAVLVDCARRLGRMRHEADVFLVATIQEETGLRGAMVSTYGIAPDVGIAVDVTHGDMPGVPEHDTARLGKGPAIATGPNVHPAVFARLKRVAEDNSIPFQVEVCPESTGTDAWAMQVTKSGVATGVISVPVRYMHTSVEVAALDDVRHAGRLSAHFAASVDRGFSEGLRCY
ncbi:MAG: M42 family metallopeptidase [Firmicutes bacterium]|nr:M42 family metallopeptidase [Bacillota bacterium]